MKSIFASKKWGLRLACALALMLCARPALAGTTAVLSETFDSAGDTTWAATATTVFAPATLASGSYDVANWFYSNVQANSSAISGHKLTRLLDGTAGGAAEFENSFSPIDMTTTNTLTVSFDFQANPPTPTAGSGQILVDIGPASMTSATATGINDYRITCDPKPGNNAFAFAVYNPTAHSLFTGTATQLQLGTTFHVVVTLAQDATNTKTNVTLAVTGGTSTYTLAGSSVAAVLPSGSNILSKVDVRFSLHGVGWLDNLKIQNTASGISEVSKWKAY